MHSKLTNNRLVWKTFYCHFKWCFPCVNSFCNIANVNSERWLAKSRVDIILCQHGKFPATLLLKFFVLYYKRNIKHFFRIDIQLYQHSWKFLVFPISTRVDITVYQHGKFFIFLKYQTRDMLRNIHRSNSNDTTICGRQGVCIFGVVYTVPPWVTGASCSKPV